jgi:iron complex transport system ATP-binding protein
VIEAHNLSFRYGRRSRWIVSDLTVSTSPGEILAVLGPNARGKTTLLKCLSGLLEPTSGTVSSDGHVAYVPQGQGAGSAFPAVDLVLMGRARHVGVLRVPGKKDREIAMDALERIGIAHLADRRFGSMSGGERQMVLIARALAGGSQTIVLDEPASALDLRNQRQVLTALRTLADEGMSVVMTTHHPDHALQVAERCLLLENADDIRTGPTPQLLTRETLSELYRMPVYIADIPLPGYGRTITVPDFGRSVNDRSDSGRSDSGTGPSPASDNAQPEPGGSPL